MYRMLNLTLLLTATVVSACWSFSTHPQQDEEDKIVLPAQDPNAVERRDSMQSKLMYSKNILEGLTAGDFDRINEAIENMRLVTEGAAWIEVDNDNYRRLSSEFKTSLRRLAAAAKTQNLDATAMRFYGMSTNCIDCHQHIRKAGYQF